MSGLVHKQPSPEVLASNRNPGEYDGGGHRGGTRYE